VNVVGGPRGRADELAGGASDPAGGGEPQGLGRQPHLGGGTCPGSVDVRPGDVQAGRAFCPGVRQPDPARLRQSPAAAPYPARSPLIKYPRPGVSMPLGNRAVAVQLLGTLRGPAPDLAPAGLVTAAAVVETELAPSFRLPLL